MPAGLGKETPWPGSVEVGLGREQWGRKERIQLAWHRESGLVESAVKVQKLNCVKERILGRL